MISKGREEMNTTVICDEETAQDNWVLVDPVHCHQRDERNKLIEKVRSLSPDGKRVQAKFKFIPEDLWFFFDHKIDHLPGMLEINGLRQLSLAMAHLIYKVPMGWIALLDWLKTTFYSYGDLSVDTYARAELLHETITKLKCEYVLTAVMHQGDKKLMRMHGKLIMLHPALEKRVRNMKVSLDAPEVNDDQDFVWQD